MADDMYQRHGTYQFHNISTLLAGPMYPDGYLGEARTGTRVQVLLKDSILVCPSYSDTKGRIRHDSCRNILEYMYMYSGYSGYRQVVIEGETR
jgi:hypothetical protein